MDIDKHRLWFLQDDYHIRVNLGECCMWPSYLQASKDTCSSLAPAFSPCYAAVTTWIAFRKTFCA